MQIGKGIEHIHDVGMIHQDLKPDNILLSMEGKTKIVDSGSVTNKPYNPHPNIIGTCFYKYPKKNVIIIITIHWPLVI